MNWEYKTIKLQTTGFTGGKVDAIKLDYMMNELYCGFKGISIKI